MSSKGRSYKSMYVRKHYTHSTPPPPKKSAIFLPLYVNGSITKVANGCLYEYFYLKNAFRAYVYYTGRHFEDTKLKK